MASMSATSVPGSGCTNRSAASAVIVRIGSITTMRAPRDRAASTTSVLPTTALVPVLTLASPSVAVKKAATAYARVSVLPGAAGVVLTVQRHVSTGWKTVTTVLTNAHAQAALRLPTTVKGRWVYRFVIGATPAHTAAVSGFFTLTVS